nr:hypothetical protein [Tanacetum cinerariifolium]
NLATASCEKKKTTHMLILNVRFTKLIIHHLKTKHGIHPRTGSPLHYSHDENVLNTLSEYQEHVAKYQQYLDAEHGKAQEGGATKSRKATNGIKTKAAKSIKPDGDKASTLTSTQPPKPKSAPTQPSKAIPKKKQKLVKETSNEPSPAKRSKGRLVGKICKPRSPLKSIIFQRRTPMLTEASRHVESPSLDAKLPLTENEIESDNVASKIDTGDQDEGQAGLNLGDHDEGQAGPNPDVHDEDHARSNPGDAAESQPQSSHVVHAGPNLKHMDLEANDALNR